MRKRIIQLGTRGSILAMWQANHVKETIEKEFSAIQVELVQIKTTGDKILDVPLSRVGGKGLFVKEIEEMLLSGKIDLAVHSMKDVPTMIPDGLEISVTTRREDPRDALISPSGLALGDFPEGAIIGTSSLRRQTQILNLYPNYRIETLRGNLDTRIRKVIEGKYDAIVLAAAGLKRLGWDDRVTEYLDPSVLLPAIGQGALGIEVRSGDDGVLELISFLNHRETSQAVAAERSFLTRLEGGCQVPIAAHGTIEEGVLTLKGLVGSTDGREIVRGEIEGTPDSGAEIGVNLAERILLEGGKEILDEVYGNEEGEG